MILMHFQNCYSHKNEDVVTEQNPNPSDSNCKLKTKSFLSPDNCYVWLYLFTSVYMHIIIYINYITVCY